jgi:hypothetical protein
MSEALHPSVDGDVVDLDAPLVEEFLDISVRESVAEVPAHCQQDHARWEPESRKRRRSKAVTTTTTNHPDTLRPPSDRQRNSAVTTWLTPSALMAKAGLGRSGLGLACEAGGPEGLDCQHQEGTRHDDGGELRKQRQTCAAASYCRRGAGKKCQ